MSGSYSDASAVASDAFFVWGTSEAAMDNRLDATMSQGASASQGSFSKALTGLAAGTTYYCKACVTVPGTGDYASQSGTFRGDVLSFTTLNHTANVSTGAASGITSSGVRLSGSYAGATAQPYEARIEYGTSSSALTSSVYYNGGGLSAPSGSFSVDLGSLSASTTYYYRAVIEVGGRDIRGDVRTFTTAEAPSFSAPKWLELPAITGGEDYVGTFRSGGARNYTYNYDYSTFTSLWVAYPLYASTMGGTRGGGWAANPDVPASKQINVWSGSYGVSFGSGNLYSRGHQIPDADRSGVSGMQSQTYYATNSTPQIQNKFNDGIWNSLEAAVRDVVPQGDTLYVVTGAAFSKVGESRTVEWITPSHDSKKVPVPNYYWKVLLKVHRSGSSVTAASAVGFWIDHREHNDVYSDYVVSVDQIEAWTGFDFFTALPAALQSSAESNTSWSGFTAF